MLFLQPVNVIPSGLWIIFVTFSPGNVDAYQMHMVYNVISANQVTGTFPIASNVIVMGMQMLASQPQEPA